MEEQLVFIMKQWLLDESSNCGKLGYRLNGTNFSKPVFGEIPNRATLVIICDIALVHHTHRHAGQAMLQEFDQAEAAVEKCAQILLGVEDLRVRLEPVTLPMPPHCVETLRQAFALPRGTLFQIKVRVLEGSEGEYRVCGATSREEMRSCKMRTETSFGVGDVVEVIGTHSLQQCLPNKEFAFVILAATTRLAEHDEDAMMLPMTCNTSARDSSWSTQMANMFCDGSLSESGGNAYLRMALLLSCIVAQSKTTLTPLHLLCVGDTSQSESLMSAAAEACGASVFRPLSLAQTLEMAFPLSKRGLCVVRELGMLVAHQSVAAKRLGEHLASAPASSCGTLWAGASLVFARNAPELPLETQAHFLSKCGLMRSFVLFHRMPVSSSTAVQELQERNVHASFDEPLLKTSIEHALAMLRHQNIAASEEARALLEGYIAVARKLRNTAAQEVSIHCLGHLFVLARAHAALCLHEQVDLDDATVAIYLLEESLLAKTGRSILNFSAALGKAKANVDIYQGGYKELLRHIQRLIQTHLPREE